MFKKKKNSNRQEKHLPSHTLAKILDMPQNSFDSFSQITLTGNQEAVLDGCQGVVEDGKAQTRFVHARAAVRARCEYLIEIEIPITQTARFYSEQTETKKYLRALTAEIPLFFPAKKIVFTKAKNRLIRLFRLEFQRRLPL